ncbi:Phosphopantetheine adenylyltransferase [Spathaspora sp. JA1]|nr:Phosphopantetheine adenylyltransferase [Spathaspora sp. JA1]
MPHPVIIIKDPLNYDYTQLIRKVIFDLTLAIDKIDIYIIDEITNSNDLNSILYHYYSVARKLSILKGYDFRFDINVLFNIDSPLHLFKLIQTWNMAFVTDVENGILNLHDIPVVPISTEETAITFPKMDQQAKQRESFQVAAVGGTFDHIHDGHKILLSVSAFLTNYKLIVGITGNELLKNKKYHEVLESYAERQASVLRFLTLIVGSSRIQFEIYEINDICGPTGYVKDINCLILSDETLSGGEYVNNYRKSRGFNELETIIIRVVASGDKEEEEEGGDSNNYVWKLSSTAIRQEVAKRLQL